MTTTYRTRFKAVRLDGTDFRTGTVNYLSGGIITAPNTSQAVAAVGEPSCYLSVSTSPTDCTGMVWPCRLLVVEPLYEWAPRPDSLPNKRACRSLRVVGERPAHEALGPQGDRVAALVDRARRLTTDEVKRLSAARVAAGAAARDAAGDAAWYAAWDAAGAAARYAAGYAAWAAARYAAWDAAGYAAWDAARYAAWDAARALVVASLITDQQFRALAGPWMDAIGDPR